MPRREIHTQPLHASGHHRPRHRRRRRTVLSIIWRGFCLSLLVVVAAAIGSAVWVLSQSPSLRQAAGVAVTGGLSPVKAFDGKQELNLLLLGKDEDRDRRGQVVKTRGRTDTIMLAHLDFARDKVSLLSIPRDTLVRIPGYRGRHKINAAHAFGGPELAVDAVERLIGVRADGHLLLDYEVFEQIIDEAGGVPMVVDKRLDYDDNWGNLHIHLKPGPQVLDGKEALGLVRFRQSNDGHGSTDQERIARQQQLLTAAKSRFTTPRMLVKLPGMFEHVFTQTDTTLSPAQAMSLATFARKLEQESIRMEILPSHAGRYSLRVDEEKARELVREMFFAGSQPEEQS